MKSTLLHARLLRRSFTPMTSTSPTPPTLREYDVGARSTDTFGRVLCSVRDHHFIVDGPVQNGCPGEEVTPVEVFLSSVAACGVELIHVIAKAQRVPLGGDTVSIHGTVDRPRQARTDLTSLNSVAIYFRLSGTDDAQGAAVVVGFKRR
jgi:uncharacterized OsmC-like protein